MAEPPIDQRDAIGWRRRELATAIAVTLAGVAYLVQVMRVSEWSAKPIAVVFAFAEVFSVITLASLCWTVTRYRRRAHRVATPRPVDIFIPTLNEDPAILEPTIQAALGLRWNERVRVFVLDDGDRPEIRHLAARLGARYFARRDHVDAKAGNLNAGLRLTAEDDPAPLVVVFDADHVAVPEFLERTVGHLDAPDVALVQTPQYYRLDGTHAVRVAAEQQSLLCDRIGPSRDGFNTMFCMGTNYVVKRAALDRVGGYPLAITEDLMLSLELLNVGLRVAYVHEPLAIGLAPPTLNAFIRQQTRWALGSVECMTRRRDVMRHIGPLAIWQYGTLPLHWFYGITMPIYLSVALAGVAFGWNPFTGASNVLLASQLIWAATAITSLYLTVRDALSFEGFLVKWGSYVITFRALNELLRPARRKFDVSEKRRMAKEPGGSTHYARLSMAIIAVMVVAVGIRGYQVSIVAPFFVSATNAVALFWLALRFRSDERRISQDASEAALPTM